MSKYANVQMVDIFNLRNRKYTHLHISIRTFSYLHIYKF